MIPLLRFLIANTAPLLSELGQSLHFDNRPATSDFTPTPGLSLTLRQPTRWAMS
jgi:hypothetical protein